MSMTAALPFDATDEAPSSSGGGSPLAGIAVGGSVLVSELLIESDVAAWLRAVGISEGEQITVLRRAAFGGPIHVRTSSGGEFALHRSLAASVMTKPVPADFNPDAESPR
jgi:Fe2+ transport system protein FeoA